MVDLEKMFKPAVISQEQQDRIVLVTEATMTLAKIIDEQLKDGREKSVVMTKLQEAKMFAVEGIAKETVEEITEKHELTLSFDSAEDMQEFEKQIEDGTAKFVKE